MLKLQALIDSHVEIYTKIQCKIVKILNVIKMNKRSLYTLFMENKVIFSVVIPTRNRESSLRNLVNKINEQTLIPDEIIIVDSSEKRQSSYNDINKSIKYLHTDKKSAAKQRDARVDRDVFGCRLQDVLPRGTGIGFCRDELTSVHRHGIARPHPKTLAERIGDTDQRLRHNPVRDRGHENGRLRFCAQRATPLQSQGRSRFRTPGRRRSEGRQRIQAATHRRATSR